jgi:hypothetical protein
VNLVSHTKSSVSATLVTESVKLIDITEYRLTVCLGEAYVEEVWQQTEHQQFVCIKIREAVPILASVLSQIVSGYVAPIIAQNENITATEISHRRKTLKRLHAKRASEARERKRAREIRTQHLNCIARSERAKRGSASVSFCRYCSRCH